MKTFLFLFFAMGISSAFAYNFSALQVKDIETSGENADNSFVIVHFESEPAFDGDAGTSGVGFYYGHPMAKLWLSVFEAALIAGLPVDLEVNTGTGVGDKVNPYKWHCAQCGTASMLKAARMNRN